MNSPTFISIGVVGAAMLLSALTGERVLARVEPSARTPRSGMTEPAETGANDPLRRASARWQRFRLGTRVGPDAVALWCDALARKLRAGATLRSALVEEVPSDELLAAATEPMRHALRRGRTVSHAITALIDPDRGTPPAVGLHARLAYTVIAVASDLGGSAAVPLDRVAAAMRLRSADGEERAAHSAQARLSAHVLTVVPLGILVLLASTDHDVRAVLSGPLGALLVGFGLLLNLGGWCWMRRIIASAA